MLPKFRSPVHPGEILQKEFLEPLRISQSALALHLGWTHAKVNEIVNEKRGVTPETALLLADAFGTTPGFWLNLQSNYDLWHAMQEHEKMPRLKKTG